ncbi:hypothetical protein Hanom_Chr05g00408791 [Helianthus anomalus]
MGGCFTRKICRQSTAAVSSTAVAVSGGAALPLTCASPSLPFAVLSLSYLSLVPLSRRLRVRRLSPVCSFEGMGVGVAGGCRPEQTSPAGILHLRLPMRERGREQSDFRVCVFWG